MPSCTANAPLAGRRYETAKLLKRMLAKGIGRSDPDPIAAPEAMSSFACVFGDRRRKTAPSFRHERAPLPFPTCPRLHGPWRFPRRPRASFRMTRIGASTQAALHMLLLTQSGHAQAEGLLLTRSPKPKSRLLDGRLHLTLSGPAVSPTRSVTRLMPRRVIPLRQQHN